MTDVRWCGGRESSSLSMLQSLSLCIPLLKLQASKQTIFFVSSINRGRLRSCSPPEIAYPENYFVGAFCIG